MFQASRQCINEEPEYDDVFDIELLSSSERDYEFIPQSLLKSEKVRINFRYMLTAQTVLTWNTTYVNKNLYIEVPHGCLPDASKDAFVALLEYAEEILGCKNAVVYFGQDRADRASLIRTFMFVGFMLVPPGNPLILEDDNKNVHMVYTIEYDE